MATPWPDQVKWVYVICNPQKEKERFERIVPHLIMNGIPKERLRVCGPTWGDELSTDLIFKVYDPFLNRGPLGPLSWVSSRLKKGEISLNLNIFAAVKDATKDLSGNDCILMLESDVYLRRDFVPRLQATLEAAAVAAAAAKPWQYISLSEGAATRPPGAPNSYYAPAAVYEPPHPWVFRTTDAQLLSADFVANLSKTLLPFRECADWEMNFQIHLHGGKALWADPPLVEQGTVFNRIGSSL